MLDQPVPNPVANNPNIHTHKVFAAVGLILMGTIISVAGIWWYVQNQSGDNTVDDSSTKTKVSTSSAEKSADSQTNESNTKDWVSYEIEELGVSFKYPQNWNDATNKEGINKSEYFLANEYFHATHPSAFVDGYPYASLSVTASKVSSGTQEEKSIQSNYEYFSKTLQVGQVQGSNAFSYTRYPNISIDGLSATYYLQEVLNAKPKYGYHVIVKKENTYIYLHLESNSMEALEKNKAIFKEFLTTIKFV